MNFYLTKDGQHLGPYSTEQIQIFLRQGLVTTSDQIWTEGWPSWMLIGNVPGMVSEPSQGVQSEVSRYSKPSTDGSGLGFWGKCASGVIMGLMLVGTFFFVRGLLSFLSIGSSPEVTISSVLKQNVVAQTAYNSQRSSIKLGSDADLDQLAQLTGSYASQLRNIDDRNCPSDFRDAYAAYVSQVDALAHLYARHPHVTTGGEAFLAVLATAAIAQEGGDDGLNQEATAVSDVYNTDSAYDEECRQQVNRLIQAAGLVDTIAKEHGIKIRE